MDGNRKISTYRKLQAGDTLEFYGDFRYRDYELDEIVDLWFEKERGGLGNEIVYGQAKVTALPRYRTGLYTAVVL